MATGPLKQVCIAERLSPCSFSKVTFLEVGMKAAAFQPKNAIYNELTTFEPLLLQELVLGNLSVPRR